MVHRILELAQSDQLGLGFLCVFAAGAATLVGAAVVFFPSMVKLADRRVLAASLGFAAGVMMYVSFLDIWAKGVGSFEEAGNEPEFAYLYTTLCFFGGAVIMMIFQCFDDRCFHTGDLEEQQLDLIEQHEKATEKAVNEEDGNSDDVEEKEQAQEKAGEESDKMTSADSDVGSLYGSMEKAELNRMGVKTATAIAFHNFPEGLATFVSYISDPWAGISLAIAIAFHNIPEGLCVALPIYYSSGSRWKGFGYAALSALSEPLGAFFGWIVLASAMTDTAYAVLFAIVGGMMVMISVTELLPTAYKYDPSGKIVSYSFLFGMAFMSISLVLLQF